MAQTLTEQEILDQSWDAVVVGSGIGGATAAHFLSLEGQKVLLIEKGSADFSSENLPLWKETVKDVDKRRAFHPFLGEGLGGSSTLYGMVMERFEEIDFQKKGGAWPLSLNEWIPYYEKAEKLFQVKPVTISQDFAPFLGHMEKQQISPKPLNLSFKDRQDCDFCQSRLCQKQCKVDAKSGVVEPDLKQNLYSLLVNAEARRILFGASSASGLEVFFNNQLRTIRAKKIFLGLGALQTPYLLKRSKSSISNISLGDSAGLLGRFLMRHFVDLYFLDWPGSFDVKNHKALGIYDFYTDDKLKSNLGIFQSFGSLPSIEHVIAELTHESTWMSKLPGLQQIVNLAVNKIFSKHIMASIIEDGAYAENRLIFTDHPQVQLQYKIFESEKRKIERSRELAKKIFSPLLSRTEFVAEDNRRLAHACGTCKMGDSIHDSVVDWNGRLHELDNVYIVDSSVFPSSSGKNPSLSIAANAIRTVEKSKYMKSFANISNISTDTRP